MLVRVCGKGAHHGGKNSIPPPTGPSSHGASLIWWTSYSRVLPGVSEVEPILAEVFLATDEEVEKLLELPQQQQLTKFLAEEEPEGGE